MNVKPIVPCLAIGFLLAACGSDSNTTTNEKPIEPLRYTVSGKVVDGYLKNAKVCLDANDNFVCDTNEPSALTDASGTYIVETTDESLLNSTRLLAEANKDTVYADSGKNVTHPFTFVAKPKANVISPFTSLIEALVSKGYDYDSAKEEIETWLNLDVDLDADYIAKAEDTSLTATQRKHYERLHFIAKLITFAIAHNLDRLLLDTEHSKKEVLYAIYHQSVKNLSTTSLEATFFHRNIGFLPEKAFLSKRFLNALLIEPEALSPLIKITQAHKQGVASNLGQQVTGTGIHSLNNFFTEQFPILWYESWLYNK